MTTRLKRKSFRFVVRVWDDEVDRLDAAANERQMLSAALGVSILRTVLHDDLVNAVLDDQKRRARYRNNLPKSLSDGQ